MEVFMCFRIVKRYLRHAGCFALMFVMTFLPDNFNGFVSSLDRIKGISRVIRKIEMPKWRLSLPTQIREGRQWRPISHFV
jgi:hypothetical protein